MRRLVRIAILAGVATLVVACAEPTSSTSSTSSRGGGGGSTPQPTTQQKETKLVKIDAATAERLQNAMIPLLKVMDHPLQPSQVKVGVMDDSSINAASAGNGEFYVTRGLLEKANDQQLAGVLAHELAHDDLNHVAKAQTLGTGLSIGAVILDQIFPGAGSIAPIAGQLVINKYTQREEYAADQHGAEILQKAGLPGRDVMANTLTWLMQTEGGSTGGFFATHPATTDRIEAIRRTK